MTDQSQEVVSKEAHADARVMNPEKLFQQLLREKLIPKAAVCQHYELGIELDLSGDDLRAIDKDVSQENVVESTRQMLIKWLGSSGIAGELIKAIHDSDLIAYAKSLEAELDPQKKLTEKDLKKIIPNIATHWKEVGIQLGIENLDIFEKNTDLTEEKFRRTLKLWLQSNPKSLDELLDIFHEALKGIELFRAAAEFKESAEEFKTKHGALNKLK